LQDLAKAKFVGLLHEPRGIAKNTNGELWLGVDLLGLARAARCRLKSVQCLEQYLWANASRVAHAKGKRF
jgi:hypothetical protein